MRQLQDTLIDEWDAITLQLDVQRALMQLTETERQLVYARLEGRMKHVAQQLGIRNPQRVWRAIQQRLKEALSGYP
jgi:FixJ family two-component response regulator